MSRARVLLDAALQLGEGERAGAAAVLAELLHADPELLAEALQRSGHPPPEQLREATRIALPWRAAVDSHWERLDLLREDWVGSAHTFRDPRADMEHWSARVRTQGAPRHVGNFPTLEEAQAAVDAALRDGEERWRLL